MVWAKYDCRNMCLCVLATYRGNGTQTHVYNALTEEDYGKRPVWKIKFGLKKYENLYWNWVLCLKLSFSNRYSFATHCRRPLIFQTITSVTSNNQSLKYQRFATSGYEDILEVVAKNKYLSSRLFRLFLSSTTWHLCKDLSFVVF